MKDSILEHRLRELKIGESAEAAKFIKETNSLPIAGQPLTAFLNPIFIYS